MEHELEIYKGHRIELLLSHTDELPTRRNAAELLIDDQPVRFGQLDDGSYFLYDYAYDWQTNLMSLAKRFIDYRAINDRNHRELNPKEEK